ncbi:hypothetical protein DXG01_015757 [Tephrocybe rancida]|nr:hypothetical protein DXG01_015757 [Tephrocybe rancida]
MEKFQVHANETFMQMDLVWVTFHGNKKIFEDLVIRKHFNISKIHNIKYYLDSIWSLGSAAGYNTEATEQLHIDLAKSGYQASNKKDGYTQQMTVWLRRQEAVAQFRLYLQWVMLGYTASKREEAAEEVEEPASNEEEEGEELKFKVQDQTTFDVGKKPLLPHITVASIIQDFSASQFLPQLTAFSVHNLSHYNNPFSTRPPFPSIISFASPYHQFLKSRILQSRIPSLQHKRNGEESQFRGSSILLPVDSAQC